MTNVRMPSGDPRLSPHDRLMCVISLLQNSIAAADTVLERDRLWGHYNMPSPALELAVEQLVELLPVLERAESVPSPRDGS